ncbi:MAG TPA: RDD family protein, partial [Candidatus Acidoferrales bacterium]|nr:RDD family protein [Candidatus Acidoferrales bacterium]
STSLPMATEPAVVLADSATLEVQADPAELPLNLEDEETARLSPAASAQIAALATPAPATSGPAAAAPEVEAAPPAAIPAIDKDYWRSAPAMTEALPEASISEPAPRSAGIPEVEELECGSLTSGFESHSTGIEEVVEEEPAPAEEEESASMEGTPATLAPADEPPAPPAAIAAAENTSEVLSPPSLDAPRTEEFDDRRVALRTASRPFPGAAMERIEISVPQPVFDFTVTHPQNLQPQDEGLPVADLRERRCAAALDGTLLALTIAGFWTAFHLAGGEFSYSRVSAAVGLTSAFLIYAQYILLFTLVGGATPGMVLRGLRVVAFDGRSPGGVELAWRAFGYLLSAAAGTLGFLWSAWDEHGLSWHDRISQTYITYAGREGEPAILTV